MSMIVYEPLVDGVALEKFPKLVGLFQWTDNRYCQRDIGSSLYLSFSQSSKTKFQKDIKITRQEDLCFC